MTIDTFEKILQIAILAKGLSWNNIEIVSYLVLFLFTCLKLFTSFLRTKSFAYFCLQL